MRWITVVAGLALAVGLALSAGCKQQCFMTECDYNHYHELGIPTNLECDPSAGSQPGLVSQIGAPATVLDPEREIRYISLAEAISIALEQGTVNGFQGPAVFTSDGGRGPTVVDTLVQFTPPGGVTSTDAIRVLALDPAISGTAIESALSKFDARFVTSMAWNTTEQPNGTSQTAFQALGQQNLQSINTQAATFNATIAKPLPTGGIAGITFRTDYQITNLTNTSFNRLNPAYTPTLQFNFDQPLLQGFGVEINQLLPNVASNSIAGLPNIQFPGPANANGAGILVSRLRFDQSRAEFERQVQLLVWNVEQAYWSLYGAYWVLYSDEQALRQAYEAWKINNARFQAGRVPIADFAQTRGQYELFRGNRLEDLGKLLEAERNLRGFLGLPMEDCKRLVPCDTPTLAPYRPDWCTALNETLALRPELVLAREELKVRQMELILAKNALLPDLRFTSSYGITAQGNRLDGPGTDNALRDLASDHFNFWSVGLSLDVPIGFRDAHAGVRLNRLNLARSYLLLRDQEYRATRFLTQTYRFVFERYNLIETRRAQREAFADQLRARFEEFLAGRGTLDILLEAQRFWAQALSSEYGAIVDYNNALASFEYAKGTILRHDNVYISEGPLPQCAQVRAVAHEQERTKALVLLERAVPVTHEASDGGKGPVLPELPPDAAASLPALLQTAPKLPPEADKLPVPRKLAPGQGTGTPSGTPAPGPGPGDSVSLPLPATTASAPAATASAAAPDGSAVPTTPADSGTPAGGQPLMSVQPLTPWPGQKQGPAAGP